MRLSDSVRDIKKNALIRVLVACVGLSVLATAIVYFWGRLESNSEIYQIAEREAAYVGETLSKKGISSKTMSAHANALVSSGYSRFTFVSFVMPDGNIVASAVSPDFVGMAPEFKNNVGGSFDKAIRRIEIDSYSFVRVSLPVYVSMGDGSNRVLSYFDAFYRLEPNEISALNSRAAKAIPIAILCVVLTALLLYPVMTSMNQNLVQANKKMLHGNIASLEALGEAIAKRDSDTSEHNYRVTIYALELGRAANISPSLLKDLLIGSFLHDVGKIGIPDHILLKPGPLDPDERKIMMTHVSLGLDILSRSEWLRTGENVVGCHHEKWDGTGYPKGLRGRQIPILGRIFAVADVFDALASERPYKKPMPLEQVFEHLRAGAGKHFDPRLVDLFIPIAKRLYPEMTKKSEDSLRKILKELVEQIFD